ncbi:hypothetical protein EXIGLDRAFT_838635 [Exidia glandulosa HHB12029]|uniref:Uncharacterized protein n=1 Tax=Exidia glandulosa HHB12029 TaxID=1314781 RepID=A0A165FNK2_EXIGL|nr:hypothetical protein EXIGLDRAFT_838635 [Exidia glandulosa HHB12029]
MADPVGLVSLGADGVRRLLDHRAAIRARKRAIESLAEELDAAHSRLLSVERDDIASTAYKDVISPLIDESVTFLERIRSRKDAAQIKKSYFLPRGDAETATALVKRFQSAQSEVELRCMALNIQRSKEQISRLVANSTYTQEPSVEALRVLATQSMLCSCFFFCGESSVTPHDYKDYGAPLFF